MFVSPTVSFLRRSQGERLSSHRGVTAFGLGAFAGIAMASTTGPEYLLRAGYVEDDVCGTKA